jgi:hypothetical protein
VLDPAHQASFKVPAPVRFLAVKVMGTKLGNLLEKCFLFWDSAANASASKHLHALPFNGPGSILVP